MSPFVFAEISRNQGGGKDKLSGEKRWWERETREKKYLCILSHFFFLSTGGKNWIRSEPGIACRDQSIMVTHPLLSSVGGR